MNVTNLESLFALIGRDSNLQIGGDNYIHPNRIVLYPGHDNYASGVKSPDGQGYRGGVLKIIFRDEGEDYSEIAICFGFHKGQTSIWGECPVLDGNNPEEIYLDDRLDSGFGFTKKFFQE